MIPSKFSILLILAVFLLTVSADSVTKTDEAVYKAEIQKWHSDRMARLKNEDGWLSLIGLFWLKPGENRIGSDRSNQIVLPKAPKYAGSIFLENQSVRFIAPAESQITSAGKTVTSATLQTDKTGKATILSLGSMLFHVIQRGNRWALRVKDKENPARQAFAGVDTFPIDSKWRIEATTQPYNPPKNIPILNIVGITEELPSPAALVFQINGKEYRLDPVAEEGAKEWSIYFKDATTGHETYGAGRYLDIDPAGPDGKVILDFNKAYNPPCAFTAFATCPLPPLQNKLDVRIEAGEKKYSASLH